jgi:hypothetical protein
VDGGASFTPHVGSTKKTPAAILRGRVGRGVLLPLPLPCRTGICDDPCRPDKTVMQWRRIWIGVCMASLSW